MSRLSVVDRTILEGALSMGGGYVLDFSNTSFSQFFDDLGVDIYHEDYAEYGASKANRLRSFWRLGSDREVAMSVDALAGYIEAKKLSGALSEVSDDQVAKMRDIAEAIGAPESTPSGSAAPANAVATEATVTWSRISIEIHEDIFSHIQQYLASGDYFHAVEEAYKVVREKLRELAGSEKSTDVFNENAQSNKHYAALFGRAVPSSHAEADFFRGIGYLHLGVQFLRNEKAHTLATFVEPNLAIHYISLASLAYDLISRSLSQEAIREVEDLVAAKRASYSSAKAFYSDFRAGRWLESIQIPGALASTAARRLLKEKWLAEADFTVSWDHSNVQLMRLELVVDQLTEADLEYLIDLPTKDSFGNDQEAGLKSFLEFVEQVRPAFLPDRVRSWVGAA